MNHFRAGTQTRVSRPRGSILEHYEIKTKWFSFRADHFVKVPKSMVVGPVYNDQFPAGLSILLPYEEGCPGQEELWDLPSYKLGKIQFKLEQLVKKVIDMEATDLSNPAQWREFIQQLNDAVKVSESVGIREG